MCTFIYVCVKNRGQEKENVRERNKRIKVRKSEQKRKQMGQKLTNDTEQRLGENSL